MSRPGDLRFQIGTSKELLFFGKLQMITCAAVFVGFQAQISIKPFAGSPGNQSGHEYLFLFQQLRRHLRGQRPAI